MFDQCFFSKLPSRLHDPRIGITLTIITGQSHPAGSHKNVVTQKQLIKNKSKQKKPRSNTKSVFCLSNFLKLCQTSFTQAQCLTFAWLVPVK